MKVSVYKAYDDLPLFLNAETVAKTLGVAPSSAYELMHVVGTSFASLASDQRPKARSLRCASSPHKAKGRLCGGPIVFPVLKVGNRMVVPKEKFILWVEQHTQGCTE